MLPLAMGGRATAIVAAVSWRTAAVFALAPSLRFAFAALMLRGKASKI